MSEALSVALLGSLFLAGVAGSLHCLAMCGPLLLAFSRPRSGESPRRGLRGALGAAARSQVYHAGRIWTYGLLGFLAGWAGSQVRIAAVLGGWQRPLAVGASVLVILVALVSLGLLPGVRVGLSLPNSCLSTVSRWPWLAALKEARGTTARFLLGAVMGLLPCGLVYAMLVAVATLPSPLHSALGMVVFGAGTLPALTALVAGRGVLPRWAWASNPRVAGVMLLSVGALMLARSFWAG